MSEELGNLQIQRNIHIETQVQKTEEQFNTGFKQEERFAQDSKEAHKGSMADQMSAGFKEVTVDDNIKVLKDPAPVEPSYIGMSKKFTVIRQDDSQKMVDVKNALRNYHDAKEGLLNLDEGVAINRVIKACDAYSKGRFRALKWGRGRQRLDEVNALRQEAMRIQESYHRRTKDTDEDPELITFSREIEYNEHFLDPVKGASLGKKIAAGVGAFFGVFVGNVVKLATLQPLWRKRVTWKPQDYYKQGVEALDRIFGRVKYEEKVDESGKVIEGEFEKKKYYTTNTSRKQKDNSATYAAQRQLDEEQKELIKEGGFDDLDEFDEEQYLDEGYDNESAYLDTMRSLTEEYRKSVIDHDRIEELERKLEKCRETSKEFAKYMQENKPESGFVSSDNSPDSLELKKARSAYESNLRINELKQRSAATKERIPGADSTPEAKEQYRKELREQAKINALIDVTTEDQIRYRMVDGKKVMTASEEFNENDLMERLDNVEALDLRTISFENIPDMLKDYASSMKILNEIKSTHSYLMRGINKGVKIPDDRLVKLRIKFRCAFEMQNYLVTANHVALTSKEDIPGDDEIIASMNTANSTVKKRYNRHFAKPGDTEGLIREIEEEFQKEYENREASIKKVYNIMERGELKGSMPKALLKQRMDAYESNAVIYDFLQTRANRFISTSSNDVVIAENERREKEDQIREQKGEKVEKKRLEEFGGGDRMHTNWIYGKVMEDKIRLTELYQGDASQKLQYYKEMLLELKDVDLKGYDASDLSTLYDDYEKKVNYNAIFANCKDVGPAIKECLKELKIQELKAANKTQEEIDKIMNDPDLKLELPKELIEETGFNSLAEITRFSTVMQDMGNNLQGKFDGLEQLRTFGAVSCLSLKELFSIGQKERDKINANLEKLADEESDYLSINEANFVDSLGLQLPMINMDIRTRAISKEEKKAGKEQPSMTAGVDVMEVYKEELEYYDKMLLRDETETAKTVSTKRNEVYTARNTLVNEAKFGAHDVESRFVKGYVSPMAHFCNDTEEKTKERIAALRVPVEKATKEQKQNKAKELESAFKVIKDFDLKKLEFEDYRDVLKEKYDDVALMTKFCFEFNDLFKEYEKLINDPESGAALTEEEYREILDKKDFIQLANTVFSTTPSNMTAPQHENYDFIKLLSWKDEDFAEAISKVKPADQVFLSNASVVAGGIQKYGFGPGKDMNKLFKDYRANNG